MLTIIFIFHTLALHLCLQVSSYLFSGNSHLIWGISSGDVTDSSYWYVGPLTSPPTVSPPAAETVHARLSIQIEDMVKTCVVTKLISNLYRLSYIAQKTISLFITKKPEFQDFPEMIDACGRFVVNFNKLLIIDASTYVKNDYKWGTALKNQCIFFNMLHSFFFPFCGFAFRNVTSYFYQINYILIILMRFFLILFEEKYVEKSEKRMWPMNYLSDKNNYRNFKYLQQRIRP